MRSLPTCPWVLTCIEFLLAIVKAIAPADSQGLFAFYVDRVVTKPLDNADWSDFRRLLLLDGRVDRLQFWPPIGDFPILNMFFKII